MITHLVTTLQGPGIGRNGNLESVAKCLCLICSPSSANFKTMFGGGTWEGGSCEEKNADFAGKPGPPLNGAWRWKGGRMKQDLDIILCVRHPRVRRCCQSASLHGTIGGKRWGEAMRECGVRGRDDLSCNGPWVNSRNFQISMRKNLCQASLGVRKKLNYLVFQRIIERSHRLCVSINV